MLLIIGGFVLVWLLSSFILYFWLLNFNFLIFNNYLLFFILITLFYFIYFITFLSFFLTFILRRVDDRFLVLWPGVRPVPLRWES